MQGTDQELDKNELGIDILDYIKMISQAFIRTIGVYLNKTKCNPQIFVVKNPRYFLHKD